MENSLETDALVERFGKLTPDVLTEFLSILRVYSLNDEELFFKWESYCLNMRSSVADSEDIKLNYDTVCAFRKDIQEQLERTQKAKSKQINNASRVVQKTPRNKGSGDPMALFDGLVPTTPRNANGSVKRKFDKAYETPSNKSSRLFNVNSPGEGNLGSSPSRAAFKSIDSVVPSTPFSKRTNAGDTIEVLNGHIPRPTLPLFESSSDADRLAWEGRVNLTTNNDIKKFSFRTMHQKLTEASEVQDRRIDDFMAIVQEHYQLADEQFGNPSTASPSEVIVVGRIASDALDGRLNDKSVVIESSRRMGAGSRVPLKLDAIGSFSFFPGQIVAVKGINASGHYFAVSEILDIPRLPMASSPSEKLADSASKLAAGPLNIVIASGPYTTDDNLLFESLDEICNRAVQERPDVLILTGPFIDSEHPLIKTGDFGLEGIDTQELGTLEDLFREKITRKIKKIERSLVILIPSIQDAVSKHVAFPQEPLKRKPLGFSQNVKCLPNPATFSLNESVFTVSTTDILFHLSHQECRRNPTEPNPIARLSRGIISQRNFYPLFPPPIKSALPHGMVGPNLDVPYMRVADFVGAIPDVMVLPSMLAPSTKVVDGVVVINGGSASKRGGAGTFVKMTIKNGVKVEEEGEVAHKIYERARVEVLRI